MRGKQTFVVGRRTRKHTTLVVLRCGPSPILGPWTLKALVSAN
ncbi:MAG TPA: hypothetical protein VFQ38_01515 [Longimicrobiales bacterium]|nr:hypothetical protein [Longimicrobiales bacterium]